MMYQIQCHTYDTAIPQTKPHLLKMNDLLLIGYGNYRNHYSILVKDIISSSNATEEVLNKNEKNEFVKSGGELNAESLAQAQTGNKNSISYDISSTSNVLQFRSTKRQNDGGEENKTANQDKNIISDMITSFTLLGSYGLNQSANGRAGDYILGVLNKDFHLTNKKNKKSSTIIAWRYGRENPEAEFYAPEQLTIIKASIDGSFIFSGSVSGNLYIWETCSGTLIHVCKAHYRAITSISVTYDGAFIITGGDDALIHVWRLIDLISFNNQPFSGNFTKKGAAMCTFSDHTLSISGVHSLLNGRIISCSLDHTCKLWSISQPTAKSGKINLISSFSFPSPVSCASITDACERELFVGTSDGVINIISLTGQTQSLQGQNGKLTGGHGKLPITYLAYSTNLLFSGDQNGAVCMWDTINRQLLTRLPGSNLCGPVKFLSCVPKFIIEEQYMFRGLQNQTSTQLFKLNPLKRYPESKEEEENSRNATCIEVYPHPNYEAIFKENNIQSASKKQKTRETKDSTSSKATLGSPNTTSSMSSDLDQKNNEELEALKQKVARLENVNQRLLKIVQMKS